MQANIPSKNSNEFVAQLSALQKNSDTFFTWLMEYEKDSYKNDLVPFPAHEEQIKKELQNTLLMQNKRQKNALEIIKETFQTQENQKPGAFEEASFSMWEKALKTLRAKEVTESAACVISAQPISLKDQMSLPSAWMLRVYQLTCDLLAQERYEDARDIYFFLHQLHPLVFEYWYGEAVCLHFLKQYKEALDAYSISLIMQPKQAEVFYQMASCFFLLGKKESSLKALEYCLELILDDATQQELLMRAKQLKKAI